jgi:CubicO group peptidase (beta-lactamase class C family)
MEAARMAGHMARPQRMQAATPMPHPNSGSVGWVLTLGNMKPTAPAVKTAANVINHLLTGTRLEFMPKPTTNGGCLSSIYWGINPWDLRRCQIRCWPAETRHTLRLQLSCAGNFMIRELLLLLALAATTTPRPALAVGSPGLPTARAESVGVSSERLARLGAGMKSLVDEGRLAGVVTMVARHGKVIEFEAIGKRNVAADLPMEKDSIFRIYSMSKPVTGVAMMMLFEEGKWQLNDPVAKYIPEFGNLKVYATDASGNMVLKDQMHPVTMRELLSHTGGFTYGYFSNTPVDKLQRDADVLNVNNSLDEMIKRVAKLPLNTQPGSEWHYSISTDIQGYIVQKLSGMPFEDFLERRIFKPLKMADTGFYVPAEKLKRLAEFYEYDKDGRQQVVRSAINHDFGAKPAFSSGGGGLVSTAADYMRFCQMLLNGGKLDGVRLISPRTVELMRTNVLSPSMTTLSPGAGFGLDFAVYTDVAAAGGYYGKGTFYWGGAAGTWFWIDPSDDLIVIGMIQQIAGTGAAAVDGVPDVRGLSHAFVYQAIVD